jgi:hypothetical protein
MVFFGVNIWVFDFDFDFVFLGFCAFAVWIWGSREERKKVRLTLYSFLSS